VPENHGTPIARVQRSSSAAQGRIEALTTPSGSTNTNDPPARPLSGRDRCEICRGQLAPPESLTGVHPWTQALRPDYVCIDCHRTYFWRDDPPRLVLSSAAIE